MTMKKKNVEYQHLESEGSSLQEPVAVYQRDISLRQIPEHIVKDIEVSKEEYQKGLAVPVSEFMRKYRNV